MKYTNKQAFQKHLENAAPSHFSSLYLIIEKESFVRKELIDFLIKVLQRNALRPFNVKTFDAQSLLFEDVVTELNTTSLLSDHTIVVIHQCDKLSRPQMASLGNYLHNPNPAAYLVLSAETLNHSSTFYKNIEKAGVILEIAEEKPWEKEKSAGDWILSKTASNGKSISADTCHYLMKYIGTDTALLHQELDKLLSYVGEKKEITPQDVDAICTQVNLKTIWQLGEAVFKCDARAALQIARALINEGNPAMTLLKQLRYQFQTAYQVSTILSQGGDPSNVTKVFPYMKGTILDRHVQMAQQYGLKRFKKGLVLIDETELALKNAPEDPEVLLDLLLVKLVKLNA
jgi:DNA polymerase-3 subunit delta